MNLLNCLHDKGLISTAQILDIFKADAKVTTDNYTRWRNELQETVGSEHVEYAPHYGFDPVYPTYNKIEFNVTHLLYFRVDRKGNQFQRVFSEWWGGDRSSIARGEEYQRRIGIVKDWIERCDAEYEEWIIKGGEDIGWQGWTG